MWGKFAKTQAKKQVTESLYEVKTARTQQTTELFQTQKLSIGMGLPFNVNGNRRQMPWQEAKDMHFSGSATLSPLMPLGT
jgi:hypothetical protein